MSLLITSLVSTTPIKSKFTFDKISSLKALFLCVQELTFHTAAVKSNCILLLGKLDWILSYSDKNTFLLIINLPLQKKHLFII